LQPPWLHDFAQNQNACREVVKVLRLTPAYISSTPFPTLLRQHLPKQFVDSSIFGTYNNACTFIKHMKYDKAELISIEAIIKPAQSLAGRILSLIITSTSDMNTRTLHKGMLLLNRYIQENGAGDGPTSVVLDFLQPQKN